jgi:COP9 signalosome complex subunit 4
MNAQTLRQQLVSLSGSSGGHKEQADRYRALLEQILSSQDANQSEQIRIFVEASKIQCY